MTSLPENVGSLRGSADGTNLLSVSNLPGVMALVPLLICLSDASAEEGGSGHYTPGQTASFIDALGITPGFSGALQFLYDEGEAALERAVPIAGQVALDYETVSYTAAFGVSYAAPIKVFGGTYGLGLGISYGWVTAAANLTTASGSLSRKGSANGFGDLWFSPAMLGWIKGDWSYGGWVGAYAPTGEYDSDNIATVGKNYWTLEPELYLSYLGSKTGLEASLFVGLDFNTENSATEYQTGDQFLIDLTVAKHWRFGKGWIGLGANGWYYQQVSGDSGQGARLGSFEGMTSGVGPLLSYSLQTKAVQFAAVIKWLPELGVNNRPKGDYVWVKLALAL